MDHDAQPVLDAASLATAASIAAFLDNQAHIIFYSGEIEARYLQMARSGAGYAGSQLAGESQQVWQIARAIEQLSASSRGAPASADLGVGHHEGPVASSSLASSPSTATFGQQAFAPALASSYDPTPGPAVFDPSAAYYAALMQPAPPPPVAPASSSRLDYSRAMQHHLNLQFATASLQDSPNFASTSSSYSTSYTPSFLPSAQLSTISAPSQQPAPLANDTYPGSLHDSATARPSTVAGFSIVPPKAALPTGAPGPSSLGGASLLGTVQESPTSPAFADGQYACFDSPPSYDSPLPEAGPSTSTSGASTSRAFSVPVGIKPEAAAAHHAWNASVNALDPEKKFICPMPSCGRGFKRIFNLKAHMNSHAPEGGKRFPCTVDGCAKGFSRKHDMERHRTAAHPDAAISTTVEGRMRGVDNSRSKTL